MSASTDNRGFGASRALPFGAAILGAALIAGAIAASLLQQNWWAAGLLGAAGLASWRFAAGAEAFTPTAVLFDALALAIFAFMRSDYPALWQLSGPWNDVPHFNIPGASIAYTLYISGSLAVLLSARRPLRAVEAIGLICIPFAFNLLITMGADWHMGEIGSFLTPGFNIPVPYKVVIGRAVVLFGVGELFLEVLAVIGAARLETNLRLHVILLVAAALGAATPMLANTAQWAVDPLAAVVVGSALAAAAQACLWSLVYIVTGLALDMMGGRPPSLATAWGHWRAGFVKGAIYGGVFMAIILAAAALLKAPGALPFISRRALRLGSSPAPHSGRWDRPSSAAPTARRRSLDVWPAPIATSKPTCAAQSSASASPGR